MRLKLCQSNPSAARSARDRYLAKGRPALLSDPDEPAMLLTRTGRDYAFRFAESCQRLPVGQAAKYWALYEADRGAGLVRVELCNLADVLLEAKRLSATHTLTAGYRSFDILHVAAAKKLEAQQFLTFDLNQRQLALAEGLAVPLSGHRHKLSHEITRWLAWGPAQTSRKAGGLYTST